MSLSDSLTVVTLDHSRCHSLQCDHIGCIVLLTISLHCSVVYFLCRKLSQGIEIPPKSHSNMVDQRSSSAPNVHNIINDANFQVSRLLLQWINVKIRHICLTLLQPACHQSGLFLLYVWGRVHSSGPSAVGLESWHSWALHDHLNGYQLKPWCMNK